MVKASEFFESGWESWFVGDLANYAFFQDKTINVGTKADIVFNNLYSWLDGKQVNAV